MKNPFGQSLRESPGPLLLTGHTGFKGTWMTFLLEHLNIPVAGYSLPAEKDSLFERAERKGAIPEVFEDIRDYKALENFIDLNKPSTIIHMAAQPLVLKSYENPRETFDVNVMGTVNLLDIAFKKDFVKAIIVVTTDKVYRNDNSGREFIESDPLEGKDPYSASKVGTEAVVSAWQQIAKVSGGPKVTSVRAGNVIGGGDFAENRIIPDLIRGVLNGKRTEIRNPKSARPWQYVLDPLLGYLLLLEHCLSNDNIYSMNFAVTGEELSVKEVVELARESWPLVIADYDNKNGKPLGIEAGTLALNSDFARRTLSWQALLSQEEAVKRTINWWRELIQNNQNVKELCESEVKSFIIESGF